ncbi:MAG: hypothetical protein JRL30_25990 [Deltaproteobacteria bacterium]|nr:hypothetical protein [Deltaproteobacteria bacterium]
MKKIILLVCCIFLILLIIPIVNSAPPFQQIIDTQGADGLTIEVPVNEFIIINQDIKANIHVFNTSDGLLMTNDTVTCRFHIYNITGNHMLDEWMKFDVGDGDFYTNIDGAGNFSEEGFRSFIIQCNTSTYGGSAIGSVTITQDGNAPTDMIPSIILLSVFGALFIIVGIILFLRKIEDKKGMDNEY